MKTLNMIGSLITAVSVSMICSISAAQSFVGTFVVVRGDVKVLRTPAANDPGPFAQLEGVKYSYEEAKIGKKINPGEVIQSGPDGKAKIAYPNGDSFLVGNGTSLIMPNVTDHGDTKSSAIKLIYGRMRSLISKSGPRNNMRVTTPNVVAGVRGTDFFTRANPDIGTQLTVLRGEVSVQSATKPEATPVAIKSGFMTQVAHAQTQAPKATEATKEELSSLQTESAVKPTAADLSALKPEQKNEIAALNSKTKDVIIADIQDHDPGLLKQLKNAKSMDDDDLNTAVVARLFKMAPSDQKKKLTKAEADAAGQGVYEKYYKTREGKTDSKHESAPKDGADKGSDKNSDKK